MTYIIHCMILSSIISLSLSLVQNKYSNIQHQHCDISLSLSLIKNKYSNIQHQHRDISLFSSKSNVITIDPVASGEALKIAPKGSETVLRCDGLTKSYTGVPQLDNVSLCICKGQRIGLVGFNGAGKSTFMKLLAKVDQPDNGKIEISSTANTIFVEQEPNCKLLF